MVGRLLLLLAALGCLLSPQVSAGKAGETEAAAPRCPLTAPEAYTAEVAAAELTASAGEPFAIAVSLQPEEPPAGFFVTTLIEPIVAPKGAKPTILTGFPRSRLTAERPGRYVFEVRANLVAKTSCGGVKARELVRSRVEVTVVSQP